MSTSSTDQTTRIFSPSGATWDPAALDRDGLPPGSRVGAYIVVSELGEGGMGRVYLADQLEPVRRQVALKIGRSPGAGFDARGFLAEHQVLAQMDHPGIARVFDAGTLVDGRPWMVMEYIRGEAIAAYCEDQALGPAARVALMVEVCRSIEHAHQRMLLHLDLKPSNLMVATVDGRPVPRVIDFGAARIRSDESIAHSGGDSVDASISGTLAYMAPEQLEFGRTLDSRADVFSLGAILYELLSGRRFRELPEHPGEDLSRLRSRLLEAQAIELRGGPLGRLGSLRQREIEAILRRATAAERERRYGSASEFAADLERWLQRRPVSTVPDRPSYRLRCLLARQALPIALAALTLTALVVGLVGTGMGLREARQQRAVAEQRQADLEQIVQFQQQMLGRVDVNQLAELLVERMTETARNLARRDGEDEAAIERRAVEAQSMIESLAPVDAARDLLVEGVLGQADALIEREYARGDRIEAALRRSLGETLSKWQAYGQAAVQVERARAIHRSASESSDPEALRAEVEALKLHWWQQQFPEAQQIARSARPLAEAALGPEHELTLYLLRAEAVMATNLGDLTQGIAIFEQLLERLTARHGADHPETLQIEGDLLYSLRQQAGVRCPAELTARYRAHLQRTARLQGPAARTHAISSLNFAGCALIEADYDEAIVRYRTAADTARAVLGERHTITLVALNDLTHALLLMGRDAEVDAFLDSFEANQRLVYGEQSYMLFYPRSYRLQVDVLRGDAERALPAIIALIDEARTHPQTPTPLMGWLWNLKSNAEEALGRLEDAEASATRSLEACLRANAGERGRCLAERTSLMRYAVMQDRTPARDELDELAGEVAALRREDPVRNLVAWLRYRLSSPGEPRDRLRSEELAWLLEEPRERLHPIQRGIRDELVRVEAGVNARP